MKTRMHNGSRLLSLLLAVVLVFTLTVPALAADKPQDMNLRIAVMSDLHYLSPDMIAGTEDFEHALNSDRKLLKESSAILYEKFEQVRADKPDILLVSGDLTKDGEQECHAALAKQLQQLQQDIPGLKIYVINGNHDIRNYNAKNFNTPDGKAVPATRTHPEDFKRIYDFVYSDPTVIATFTPAAGNEAGSLSYVARPVEGLTIIAMDTCRYSKENTSNGTDEHETSGAISADLGKWVIEQTAAAKARGDLVIGLEHHGLVPHFDVEPTILPMYLVNGYERIAQEYADAGMSVVFTGHMHAVDIAAMTTKAGNTFYDIETGSALTYPCPVRFVDLRRSTVGGETSTYMSVSTKTHTGPIHYTDPATGTAHVIDDLTEYAREFGFSTDMLKTVAGDFVKSFFGKYLPNDTWPVTKIVANIDQIIDDVVAVPIVDGKDLSYNNQSSNPNTTGALVSEAFASANNLKVGDTLKVAAASDAQTTAELKVRGIYKYTSESAVANPVTAARNRENAIFTNYQTFAKAGLDPQSNDKTASGWAMPDLDVVFDTGDPATYKSLVSTLKKSKLPAKGYEVSSPSLESYNASLEPLDTLSSRAKTGTIVLVAVGGVLLLILVLSGVWAPKRDDEIGMALVSGVTRGRLGWQFMLEVFIVTLPFYVIGLVGGAFAANPIGSALASGHATPVTSGLIWTMVWYGLGSILILAILAALRLAFFSADKLFAADGDWGTVSETNKTTTTTDDAEAQA